jgi:hypothetical protein
MTINCVGFTKELGYYCREHKVSGANISKTIVYFIMYGAPDLVVPASGVIQKNKVVSNCKSKALVR